MVLCVKYLIFKVNIMAQTDSIKGSFSPVSGNNTRRMFDDRGNFLGLIIKQKDGYRVQRIDGKSRVKKTLAQAFASIARSN